MPRAKRPSEQPEADKQLQAALAQLHSLGAVDLAVHLERGELPVAHGRERELARVFATLAERRSVLLLGPSGVGKTAIIYETAARMLRGRAPEPLRGVRVVQASTTTIEAGSINAGVWASKLQALLRAIALADGRVVVYLDNIWNLPEAGRYTGTRESFSTFLRPHVDNRSLVLLGESTPENLTHAGGQDSQRGFALADDPIMAGFVTIGVEEPDLAATREVLQIVAFELEENLGVRIEPVVLERVIELARRFQPYEAFPGKAIRLLDRAVRSAQSEVATGETGRSTSIAGGPAPGAPAPLTITPAMITERFARQTGLPERLFSDAVPVTAAEVEAYFSERVVGQAEAVGTLVDLVTLIKAELTDPRRPLGVLLFVGPTGSGKTFLARTMAEYLFGSDTRLVRFDMSEYQSPASVYHLQRQLTDRVRQHHFSVMLLDEIEKAAPNIFDLFLQVFDDARLTDPQGHTVDLKNVVFVMTSNLGGGALAPRGLGFGADGAEPTLVTDDDTLRRMRAIQAAFRPEFINRLDKIVVFRPLGRDAMRRIARRELGRALEREGLRRRSILLDFGDDVLDLLLEVGFSQEYGARPLQRAIKEQVLVPLARRIAANPSATDQLLELRAQAGGLGIETIPLQPPSTAAPHLDDVARPEPAETAPKPQPVFARLVDAIHALQTGVADLVESAPFRTVEARTAELLGELARPSFWDDQERARRVNSAIYQFSRSTQQLAELRRRVDALAEVPTILMRHRRTAEMAELDRLQERVQRLQNEFGLAQLELLAASATDPHDLTAIASAGCLLTVIPAAAPGAADAGDWPATLARMYLGWASRRGFEAEAADADGVHAVTIKGLSLAEILRGEVGVHKLQLRAEGRRRPAVRLARVSLQNGAATDAGTPPLVRVYHLSGAAYVRDPRTGHRSGQPREVLGGAIDGFLLAYLRRDLAAPSPGLRP